MPTIREPILHPVAIDDLHPTQITVGMREVAAKRKEWRTKKGEKGADFLGRHMIPVILGPKDKCYVIDHHHLTRALYEERVKNVMVTVMASWCSGWSPMPSGSCSTIIAGCIRSTIGGSAVATATFRNRSKDLIDAPVPLARR